MNASKSIDIYIVSYNHEDFICRSILLAQKQNPQANINWYIGVTGNPEDFAQIVDDPTVKIFSDIHFEKDNQHMRCMYYLISNYGDSRYKLILDPDFFLIQDDWVRQCIDEVDSGNFGCIATQWHPSWRKQKWGLAPHFLFYDAEKIFVKRKDLFPTRSFRAMYNIDSGMLSTLLKGLEVSLSYVQRLDKTLTGGRLMRVSDTCAGLSWRLKESAIQVLRLGIHFKSSDDSRLESSPLFRSFSDLPVGPYCYDVDIDNVLADFPGSPELHYLGVTPFGVHARKYGRSEQSISASGLLDLAYALKELRCSGLVNNSLAY